MCFVAEDACDERTVRLCLGGARMTTEPVAVVPLTDCLSARGRFVGSSALHVEHCPSFAQPKQQAADCTADALARWRWW